MQLCLLLHHFQFLDDDEDENQGDMEDIDDDHSEDIYPPALPPKRGPLNSRGFSWTSGSPARPHSLPPRPQRSTSSDERIIPIVIERSGSVTRPPPPQRQESTSSAISTAGEGKMSLNVKFTSFIIFIL